MKIVLVIPTMKQGGAERVMSELANHWAREGHVVTLILLLKREHFYQLDSRIKVKELFFENRGKINKIYNEFKLFLAFRGVIKEESADFILSFMEKYNLFALLSTIGLKEKVFVSDRSSPHTKVPLHVKYLRRLVYPYAEGIVAQTSLAEEILFKETGHKNINTISNPLKKVFHYPKINKEKIILNIGRLHPLKGQGLLLEIFAKSKRDGWKLVILGDGELLEELKKRVKILGIENDVLFIGQVDNVDEWLARASIFAFTSLSEGFPNALAEAMSAKLSCISFDCETGPSELIIDGLNGFLIPLENQEIFIKRLEELIVNESLRDRLGIEAGEIGKRLDINKIANDYLSFCSSSSMNGGN